MVVITLQNIFLQYASNAGQVNALRDVSLNVAAGESVAIVGPSGSGKTSLLTLMGGLEKPTAGDITVDGVNISALSEDALAQFRRGRIGIVFQSFHLIPTMTALENVAVSLELMGDANAFEKAQQELYKVGLAQRITHYPAQLSGGEQQRVALARALVAAPRVILADEPTGNLDSETGRQVTDMLFALQRERQATLILVTHDEVLAARCDRTLRLKDGQLS
ncbi:MAG: ATP-binding cassette domain-containing protein [Gammaproteobacteria bacterium]|nr:ATP-binding cassette domain-containing protein [Gammaproteobacteria bacterium]